MPFFLSSPKFKKINDATRAYWGARSSREQFILSGMAFIGVVFLIYAILWAPAATQREKLNQNIPTLRSQLVEMRALANEAKQLSSSLNKNTVSIDALKDEIQTSLKASKLDHQAQFLLEKGNVQIQLKAVSFSQWIDWLDAIRQKNHAKLVDARIDSSTHKDIVDITFSMALPKIPSTKKP